MNTLGEREGKREEEGERGGYWSEPVKPCNWKFRWCRLSAVIVSFHSFVSSKVTGLVRWYASAHWRNWASAARWASNAGAWGRCRRRRFGNTPLRIWPYRTVAASNIGGLRNRTRSANRWWCTVHEANIWLCPVCDRRLFSVFWRLPCMCQSLSKL